LAPLAHCQPQAREARQAGSVLKSPTQAIPGTARSHAASLAVRMLARAPPGAAAAYAPAPAAHVPGVASAA